jgi:hypothetical protein
MDPQILALIVNRDLFQQKKKVVLRSLGQCKGQQSLPMVWYDFAPKHDEKTGDSMASIKVRTKALVSEDLSVRFYEPHEQFTIL